MSLQGQSSASRLEGVDLLPGKTHYLKGSNAAGWHGDLPAYERVRHSGVYPGVDLIYYGNQQQLEYDVVVAPGANPDVVRFRFDGIRDMRIQDDGQLVLDTAAGEIRQPKPVIYQESGEERRPIAGGYAMRGDHVVGFEIGAYDRSKPLVIDPVIIYSSFFGGTGTGDQGIAITLDPAGNAYITGQTTSPDLFIWGGFQPTFGGQMDGFVLKLDPTGTTILYATYFGGTASDEGHSIAVDSGGNAYITGLTSSTDFAPRIS